MKKWATDYLDIMKLVTNKQTVISMLSEILSEYHIITEENPFAAAEKAAGGEEEPAEEEPTEEPATDAEADGGEEKDDKKAKPSAPAGIVVDFDISAVKKYNEAPFRSNRGEVKAITKDGLQIAVDNNQMILVNFQDITSE